MLGSNQASLPDANPHDMHWEFLEIEIDDWEHRVAGALAAAAQETQKALSNAAARQSAAEDQRTPVLAGRRKRTLALCGAVALVLLLVCVYAAWKATGGLAAMHEEIAGAVRVEVLRDASRRDLQQSNIQVVTTDFLDGKARAEVVVTQTLPSGAVLVERQNRFYVQTPQGWQRTGPDPNFWGATRRLDSPHLHFIYRALDAEAVQQVALQADAFYDQLRHILAGTASASANGLIAPLAVEIVPQFVLPGDQRTANGLRIGSPQLIATQPQRTRVDVLAWQLRRALVDAAIDDLLRAKPAKPQWSAVMDGLHGWLLTSPKLPLATAADNEGEGGMTGAAVVPSLDLLLAGAGCTATYQQDYQCQGAGFPGQVQTTFAPRLIDYLVTKYGETKLPALVQGMSRYDNWDDLAPAVFGVSKGELGAGWMQAARRSR